MFNRKFIILHLQKKEAMKLIIMTMPTFFVEEDKILSTLFEEGMDSLHLNKPGSSPIYSERLLSLLPEEYYRKITVHNHFYLKNEYDLAGIHIDNPATPLPEKYKGRITRTCTDIENIREIKKKSEYVFLNGVFGNIPGQNVDTLCTSKLELAARQGLIDKHVYAMGGVTLENIKIAHGLGFGGVVVCADLWNKFDIHNGSDYKELINHFEKLKKAIS